ncbi:MAG: hypothetical protein O3A46_04635 [Candidatus Poribacteria bacterium]|nr:hypothetical protein [Candidatus Poribacteria bacterium]
MTTDPLVVARGSLWERLVPTHTHRDAVYGRDLTWRTNDAALSDAIRLRLIDRWRTLDIPPTGVEIEASAFLCPARYLPFTDSASNDMIDVLHPHVGYQLIGSRGFGTCSWDRRRAVVCVSKDADLPFMLENLVNHVWSAAILWHPPLYGLHAAALACEDGRGTLFVGKSNVGKSSLVAALAYRHGFHYLSDDLVLLDGRSLNVYGRPWRLELRDQTASALWGESSPKDVSRVGEKTVVDPRGQISTRVTADIRSVCFLERGERNAITPLSADATRARLGEPVCLFRGEADPIRGSKPAFDAFSQRTQGFALTLDHREGILAGAAFVAECLADHHP